MLYPFELRAHADFILPAEGAIPNLALAVVLKIVFLQTSQGAMADTKVPFDKGT
jgi:hypothetical protein